MIHQRFHLSSIDVVSAQPHSHLKSCDEDILNYILEELTEQHNNSYNYLSSIDAATDASM
jgi:lipopolysaccharide biosynthesis glycosyltransferase